MDHFKIVKHCLLISEIEITIFKIVDYWLQFMDQVSGMGKELKKSNPFNEIYWRYAANSMWAKWKADSSMMNLKVDNQNEK